MNDDRQLEFVDTNILIYAHDTTAGEKHQRAISLLSGLWSTQRGCLSVQILQEFYVNVTRKLPQRLSPEQAVEIIADFAAWPVFLPNAQDVLAAITLQGRYDLSFWDAMVVWSASRLACTILWSEGLNAGQVYEGVRVLNPFGQ
jgi:predicted nucleic acid-binding protein